MKVFPAVDILAGDCVQLVQGRRETATRYGTPLDCALRWKEEGADGLHVVNLDGAFGSRGANADLIREIIEKTGLMIELGGGIRTYEDAARWLEAGLAHSIQGIGLSLGLEKISGDCRSLEEAINAGDSQRAA